MCVKDVNESFFLGYFDQYMRQNLFTKWCHNMHQVHIQFKPDIARIEVSVH